MNNQLKTPDDVINLLKSYLNELEEHSEVDEESEEIEGQCVASEHIATRLVISEGQNLVLIYNTVADRWPEIDAVSRCHGLSVSERLYDADRNRKDENIDPLIFALELEIETLERLRALKGGTPHIKEWSNFRTPSKWQELGGFSGTTWRNRRKKFSGDFEGSDSDEKGLVSMTRKRFRDFGIAAKHWIPMEQPATK